MTSVVWDVVRFYPLEMSSLGLDVVTDVVKSLTEVERRQHVAAVEQRGPQRGFAQG